MSETTIKGMLQGKYDEGSGWWISVGDEDISKLLGKIDRNLASAQVEIKITKFIEKVDGEYSCTLCGEKIRVLKTNKEFIGGSDAVCKCTSWEIIYNPIDDQIYWDSSWIWRKTPLVQSSNTKAKSEKK